MKRIFTSTASTRHSNEVLGKKFQRCFLTWVILTFAILCGPPVTLAASPVLVGTVIRVVDGDTVNVRLRSGPIRVRLDGIDAPELKQPFGTESMRFLDSLIGNKQVELEPVSQDRYERLVARLFIANQNINDKLVASGHAWAYRGYLKMDRRYLCDLENRARVARVGLWAASPQDWIYPPDWRRVQRHQMQSPQSFANETTSRCLEAAKKRQVR